MLSIIKRKKKLLDGLIDFHNHILPNLDDGSKNNTESMKMLKLFEELGITKLIPSPHIFKELYPNTEKKIKKSFDDFGKVLIRKKTNVELLDYTAEYMVDEFLIKKIIENHSFKSFKNKNLLIEIPIFCQLNVLREASYLLFERGYTPILAHPERCFYLNEIDEIKKIRNTGILIQLNIMSLIGKYGKLAQKKARKWINLGLYDFACTDAHKPSDLLDLKNFDLGKKSLFNWNKIKEFQKDFF